MKPPADIMEGKASAASPSRLQNRGPGKSTLSLQELQELAERQKQQIYMNNKELLAKQQKLLKLQQTRFRNEARYNAAGVSQHEQDSYAAKLRETYQNHLERLREMQVVQDETDAQRFSNIELSFELDRVRDMFLSKQRELASAVAKVESLTKQLEERKSGVTTWNITPEKMRRRRKIQAAREELDKLRNEMTIRNELNNQQSHQLKVQKEILREKQRELNDLDAQIHMLGKQLRQYQTKGQVDNSPYKPLNGDVYRGNFTPANLYDSLQRKRIASKSLTALNLPGYHQLNYSGTHSPSLPDVNGNVYQQGSPGRNGYPPRASVSGDSPGRRKLENGTAKRGGTVPYTRRGNLFVAPDGREFDRPPTWDDFLNFDKHAENGRGLSPSFQSQSEYPQNGTSSTQPPSSPNLPRGRTDVKPAVHLNGSDSGSPVQNSPSVSYGPLFRDSPLSGHQAKKELFPSRQTDSLKPVQNGNSLSPSSSVSSLSSMSSSMTNDDVRPIMSTSRNSKEMLPPHPSYLARPEKSSGGALQGYLPPVKQDVWNDSTEFRALESSSPIPLSPEPPMAAPESGFLPKSPSPSPTLSMTSISSVYKDSLRTTSTDFINSKVIRFMDSKRSSAREIINYSYLHRALHISDPPSSTGVVQSTASTEENVQKSFSTANTTPVMTTTTIKPKPQVAPKPNRQPPPPPSQKPISVTSATDPRPESTRDLMSPYAVNEPQNSEQQSVKDLVERFAGQESSVADSTMSLSVTADSVLDNADVVDGAVAATENGDGSTAADLDNTLSAPPLDETDNVAVTDFNKEFPPPPPYIPKIPDHDPPPYSEIENYELSPFADIDMISATQNDLLPFLINASRAQYMNDSQDSMYDSDSSSQKSDEKIIVPVVISVPPEKMPPPILMKPGKDRRPKRKVQLDPHALLLDASLEGELTIVKQVLGKVPDPSLPNAEGITALHNAVCGNHKNVVKFLVEIGCDINSADNNGWTPLHCAAFYNDTELCRYLVEHGASVYATTYSDCQTPSQKCSRLEDNYDQCFQYLHDCKDHVGKLNNNRVYGLFDYSSEGEDELSFSCGEVLTLQRRGDSVEKEWWWAENQRGEAGYVPFNLLGLYPRVAAEV